MSMAELPADASPKPVTVEDLLRDFHDVRCNLLEGKVHEMSPPGFEHGSIEVRVGYLLSEVVAKHGLGLVVVGDVGFVVQKDPDTVLGADVAFVRQDRVAAVGVTEKYFPEAPALAVEITSPGDTANDVDDKVRRWLAAGCETVWVVYPRGKSVTVYRSLDDVHILTGDAVLDGGEVVPGFSHPISKFFQGLP